MDFSSALANEILKKKAQLKKRRRNLKEGLSRDELTEVKKAKELESLVDSNESAPHNDHVSEDVISYQAENDGNGDDPEVRHTPSNLVDPELTSTISNEQLNSKLDEFGELVNEPGLSKLQKIKKLQILMTFEAKHEKYKVQIDKESKLSEDPLLKQIDLLHIADAERHRDILQVQLRVLLKDIVSKWEAGVGKDADLLEETKRDLVLLLYRLRANKLSRDMLTSLATILYYIQHEDFRRANESYMKLSIGNVAWPIGIRDVGIHARSATLKITGEKNAANIMINDKTRRWITSIKRLLTYSERLFQGF